MFWSFVDELINEKKIKCGMFIMRSNIDEIKQDLR